MVSSINAQRSRYDANFSKFQFDSSKWPLYLALYATLVILLYKLLTRNFGYWSKRNVPFVKPLPFFGNFLDAALMRSSMGDCLGKLYHSMDGPYFGAWIFNTPHFIIRSPELIRAVLVKDFNHFFDRTVASDEKADSMAANFLFLMKNPSWKQTRAKMTPVFTPGKLKGMFQLMAKAADDLEDYLRRIPGGIPVDAKEICAKFSTDVLTSTAFGIEAHSFDDEDAAFRVIGRKMFNFDYFKAFKSTCYFFAPGMVSLLKLKFFEGGVYQFLRDAFWKSISARENGNSKRNDVVDVMVEMKNCNDGVFDFSKF